MPRLPSSKPSNGVKTDAELMDEYINSEEHQVRLIVQMYVREAQAAFPNINFATQVTFRWLNITRQLNTPKNGNRPRVTYGYTYYKRDHDSKPVSTIALHPMIKNPRQEKVIRNLVMHELAHAIVWITRSKDDGHGYYFGWAMISLGENPYDQMSIEYRHKLANFIARNYPKDTEAAKSNA